MVLFQNEMTQISLDDWHQNSWYPTNATYNSRNKGATSRWAHVDELMYMGFEKLVYGGKLMPRAASFWKKQARAKQGDLDSWIESHAQNFLDTYIRQKERPY